MRESFYLVSINGPFQETLLLTVKIYNVKIASLRWAQNGGLPFSSRDFSSLILSGEPNFLPYRLLKEDHVALAKLRSSTFSFLVRTCPASTWMSLHRNEAFTASLNSRQWNFILRRISSHFPRVIHNPWSPWIKCMRTSCFVEYCPRGLFHWMLSKRVVTLKSCKYFSFQRRPSPQAFTAGLRCSWPTLSRLCFIRFHRVCISAWTPQGKKSTMEPSSALSFPSWCAVENRTTDPKGAPGGLGDRWK